jgi:sorting nexin-4
MIKEFEIFQKAREAELKQGLAAYADCHIDFYKKVPRVSTKTLIYANNYFMHGY